MLLFRSLGLSLLHQDATSSRKIKLLRVINHIWLTVSVAIFAYLLKSHILTRDYSDMSNVIKVSKYTMVFVAHVVILLHTQGIRRKDVIWHEKILFVESLLRTHFGVKINHGAILRWNLVKTVIVITFTVACSIVNFYFDMRSSDFLILLSVHDYILRSVINLRYLQNSMRINLITEHIEAFHQAIRTVVERNKIKWRLVDKFNQQYDNPMKIDDAKDVLIFKRIHAALYESTKLLENCFGWSLLTMLSFTFIDLTSNLYWCCLALFHIDDRFDILDCIVDIIPPIIAVSFLIYSSFDLGRKTREKVVYWAIKLYTNTSSVYNVMVKEFLLQLYHEKMENSANDFFLVDFKLLVGVRTIKCFENFIC